MERVGVGGGVCCLRKGMEKKKPPSWEYFRKESDSGKPRKKREEKNLETSTKREENPTMKEKRELEMTLLRPSLLLHSSIEDKLRETVS